MLLLLPFWQQGALLDLHQLMSPVLQQQKVLVPQQPWRLFSPWAKCWRSRWSRWGGWSTVWTEAASVRRGKCFKSPSGFLFSLFHSFCGTYFFAALWTHGSARKIDDGVRNLIVGPFKVISKWLCKCFTFCRTGRCRTKWKTKTFWLDNRSKATRRERVEKRKWSLLKATEKTSWS